ncbi:hypothetical protein LSS_10493 [Leptospira santarosai serovar Shermani str. LT 821]|uniref:Uncharacterized protein n=1 Tax=Leptospira santarosai serovar Shermani str. LT 821 TaxID=758847 RepID=K8YB77_9LEPT|nr:hypothetical protein LSS_10493 [Leptospira santarosai serovar Shermani str. LT 821]
MSFHFVDLIREIGLLSFPFSLKSGHSKKVSFEFCFDPLKRLRKSLI